MAKHRFFIAAAATLVILQLAACRGGGGGSSADNNAAGSTTSTPVGSGITTTVPAQSRAAVALLAGNDGGLGYRNGPGSTALFDDADAIVTDNLGNRYVTDADNYVIRKIDPANNVTIFAGTPGVSGSVDGVSTAARFAYPQGIAVDVAGNLYVVDRGNNTIREVTPDGTVTTIAGVPGVTGSANGPGSNATFKSPSAVAVDDAGNLYIADTGNYLIREISAAHVVTTIAGTGSSGTANGPIASAQFQGPSGVAVDGSGNVYVTDRYEVRKIAGGQVTTFAGSAVQGTTDGSGGDAAFVSPSFIHFDGTQLLVADFTAVRSISLLGAVVTLYTVTDNNYLNDASRDSNGNIEVVQSAQVQLLSAGTLSNIAGDPSMIGNVDGQGASAAFRYPGRIASDGNGNLYIADVMAGQNNPPAILRKVNAAGEVSTVNGAGGTPLLFGSISGIVVNKAGVIYLTDDGLIKQVSTTGVVTVLAGNNASSSSGAQAPIDGQGTAAIFTNPGAITVDASGNLYVADNPYSLVCCGEVYYGATIRRITADGAVTTIAGNSAKNGNGDGYGTTAEFGTITGLALDPGGNMFVVDSGNLLIRKFSTTGYVSTIAHALPAASAQGVNGPIVEYYPYDIAVDAGANIYLTYPDSATVVTLDPQSGGISVYAGTAGLQGDVFGPLPSTISAPFYMTINGNGLAVTTQAAVLTIQ